MALLRIGPPPDADRTMRLELELRPWTLSATGAKATGSDYDWEVEKSLVLLGFDAPSRFFSGTAA
jgi:hypothetical protein